MTRFPPLTPQPTLDRESAERAALDLDWPMAALLLGVLLMIVGAT